MKGGLKTARAAWGGVQNLKLEHWGNLARLDVAARKKTTWAQFDVLRQLDC